MCDVMLLAAASIVCEIFTFELQGDLETGVGVTRGTDLHMAQLMPLPLTICYSSKARLVLPFWYWLTQVVPDRVQGDHKTDVVAIVVVVVVVV